jgi:succinoglycan biosynthesis protein ExoA
MLNPKPRAELPDHVEGEPRDNPGGGGAPPEPRAFAAVGERFDRSPWSVRAPWPPAWADLDPAVIIHVPPQAANAPPPLDEEAAARRALIVIPCLNEAPVIAKVIAQVLDDDGLVDPLLLVADGGSRDGSREIVASMAARDPRVRLLTNPGRLQSAGVNLAARLVGEGRGWLVRIDAHADYPRNYASTLIAEARRTGAHSIVVAMETIGEGAFQRAVAAAQNSRLGTGGAAHRVGGPGGWVDHGHHALFKREVFQAVGGYDENFSHNEDAELDLRLTQQGARIWLTDRTRIIYRPRRTPGALWRQYLSYGRGRARTVLKHRAPLKLRQALPLGVAPAVFAAAASPLFAPLAAPAAIWTGTTLTWGLVLSARRRDPAVLMSGPVAMIMHLAWSIGFWSQLAGWIVKGRGRPPTEAGLEPAPVTT